MSYKIISDSACDYPYLEDDYPWLIRVPITLYLDGETFVDDKDLRCNDLLTKMAASRNAPTSSFPSPGEFEKVYDCGADDIYVVTISDKLSGSYNSAVIAASMFKEKNPDKNIFVFSSRSASGGQTTVCSKINELAASGLSFDEVTKQGLEFINGLNTYFVLEDLDVFRKNGRINHLQSIITGALKLKLVMGADETGNVVLRGKALSIERAVAKMVDLIAEKCKGKDMSDYTLFISHCNCPDRARKTRDMIMERINFRTCQILRMSGISSMYGNTGGQVAAF